MTYSITVPDALRYQVVSALIAADFVLEPVESAPSQSPRFVVCGMDGTVPPAAEAVKLTDREMGTLRRIAQGMSNPQIGRAMGISEDTAKTHCRRLFRKLGARDRAQAVHIAWQRGILGGAS